MNLRVVFKFKDCKLQFYEKRRLFSYFSVNPRTPDSRWHRLLKPKRKKIKHFLTRLAHHKCVFFKGSERLQAVMSALTSGRSYRLPPDKENPVWNPMWKP